MASANKARRGYRVSGAKLAPNEEHVDWYADSGAKNARGVRRFQGWLAAQCGAERRYRIMDRWNNRQWKKMLDARYGTLPTQRQRNAMARYLSDF